MCGVWRLVKIPRVVGQKYVSPDLVRTRKMFEVVNSTLESVYL